MVGGTIGGIFSQLATASFGVTNTDFSRLWQLTLLTCTARLFSLCLLPLVPRSAAFMATHDDSPRSKAAGAFILALFVGGLVWALVQVARAL